MWQHTITGKIKQISNTTLKHKPLLWTRKFPDGNYGDPGFQKKRIGSVIGTVRGSVVGEKNMDLEIKNKRSRLNTDCVYLGKLLYSLNLKFLMCKMRTI